MTDAAVLTAPGAATAPPASAVPPPGGGLASAGTLSPLARDALLCLYQHRLLSSVQLRRMLLPAAADTSYMRRELRRLLRAGLVAFVTAGGGSRLKLWYLTVAGADVVEPAGELPIRAYRMTHDKARGPLQAHTIAVNDTGLAFLDAARARGHECSPLDWTPEVAHRLRDGMARRYDEDHLIADAVLNYTAVTPAGDRIALQFFVEVDRATMSAARLAAKLSQYARYHDFVPGRHAPGPRTVAQDQAWPAWRLRYPKFPRLLVVLTGRTEAQLRARIEDLRAHTAADARLRRLAGEIIAGVTTLDWLARHGPFCDIVVPLLTPEPTPTTVLMRSREPA